MEKDKDLGADAFTGSKENMLIIDEYSMYPHPTAEQEEGIRKHNAARKKLVDEVKKEWEEKQLKKLQPKKK